MPAKPSGAANTIPRTAGGTRAAPSAATVTCRSTGTAADAAALPGVAGAAALNFVNADTDADADAKTQTASIAAAASLPAAPRTGGMRREVTAEASPACTGTAEHQHRLAGDAQRGRLQKPRAQALQRERLGVVSGGVTDIPVVAAGVGGVALVSRSSGRARASARSCAIAKWWRNLEALPASDHELLADRPICHVERICDIAVGHRPA